MKRGIQSVVVLAMSFVLLIAQVNVGLALELVITENGSGSSSEVNVQTESNTTIEQSNTGEVENNVDTSSNTGGNTVSGNVGDVEVITGDAQTGVSVENNINYSSVEHAGCCGESVSAEISGNGDASKNTINVNSAENTVVSVNQTAKIINNISGTSNTGKNSANENSGDVVIKTGDAKGSLNLKNASNVSSIKVADSGSQASAKISENGASSVNKIDVTFENKNYVFVDQYSEFANWVNFEAETGGNTADKNIGNVKITTGDASLALFIENFVNLSDVKIDCCTKMLDPDDPDDPRKPVDNGDDKDDAVDDKDDEKDEKSATIVI